MREKTIEAKLVQAVRTKGGLAPKFTSPGKKQALLIVPYFLVDAYLQ